ncbi:hypothetical protein SprV_0200820800 [Sparganum proliferum]
MHMFFQIIDDPPERRTAGVSRRRVRYKAQFAPLGETGFTEQATTIFAADEGIQEGQLVVFFVLHRKLNVREDGVGMFFECPHLIPFDDDESIIHILSPEFRSVVSEIGEPIGVPFTCS